MATSTRYYLFVSHAWRYNEEYVRFVNLLDSAANFSWSNYSVPRHDPLLAGKTAALKRELDDQIRPAQVVVVLAGMYASYSDWIGYEIDKATEWKKPILGVQPWGSARLPSRVTEAANRIAGWNTGSITQGIKDLA